MSYPNPQNPYGQQQPQQPGYGYPPQAQQPQQAYGYPQQQSGPAFAPYPGGPAGMPVPHAIPGPLKAARVMLFVLAGLCLLGTALSVVGLGFVSKASKSAVSVDHDSIMAMNVGKSLLIAMIVVSVVFAAVAVGLALSIAKGGPGVRVALIVYGAFTCVVSFVFFPWGLVHMVLGILCITFASKQESSLWFNRPGA